MKSGAVNVFLTFIFFVSISSCRGCSSSCDKVSNNDYSKYAQPVLTFPGLGDVVTENTNNNAVWPWIKIILSAATSFIPYGGSQLSSFIINAVDILTMNVEDMKKVFTDLLNDSLAKSAIVDIQAKVVTVKNRIRQIHTHIEEKTNYNIPLGIAMNTCEEILQKFSSDDSYLFRSGNALISTPALVSFANVFSAISVMAYQASPNDRAHILNELRLLLRTLEKYRTAAIKKRISYIYVTQRMGNGFQTDCPYYWCIDEFHKVAPACRSCSNVKCQWKVVEKIGQSFFQETFPLSFFRRYELELKEKYDTYFNQVIRNVGNVLAGLGHAVDYYAPSEKFPATTLHVIHDSNSGVYMVG